MTAPLPLDLEEEGERLLAFARAAVHPDGGFGWLSEDGRLEPDRPVELWITCRMTHVFALAHLQGHTWAAELVDHGVAALAGRFRDPVHGGWYAAVDASGPVTRSKTAYEHAFVVLAASSAATAGRPGADALLADALDVLDRHFWDDAAGMVVEEWDESWSVLDGYRGVNATMHWVEALLAVGDVERAKRIVTRVVHGFARSNDWRIPEHFGADWQPLPDYHRDEPAHPFRPYGATVGHWFEWSRLTLSLRAALGSSAPDWMLEDAVALFDAGVREGWAVDGAEGFVYTVDWDGAPVVRQRMHWVVTEALAAAATLEAVTGDRMYAICARQWWAYAARHLVDPVGGSWHHELGPDNRPAAGTWAGKPDVYHAFQATLVPRLPLWPPFARALAGTDGFVVHGSDVETVWEGDVPRLTPNDRFYVRNHTTSPVIDADTWRLVVSGDGVAGERVYSLADLKALPTTTYERAVECTGNGRRLFAEQQGTPRPGTQWGMGAIGVARWTGVPLATLLRDAGLSPDAVQVMAIGLDDPYVEDGTDWGRVRRPLPIAKALDDVLVAWEMNGEPLPRDHGHPVRLVVPGWVGIASIKWLGELQVTTTPVESPWTTRWYRMHGPGWSGDDAVLGRMPVKSVVDAFDDPTVGRVSVLRGRAWAGDASIRMVEVSTDGGDTWDEASLTGPNEESAWVHWEHPWTPSAPGDHVVVTRATDSLGRTQPDVAPDNDDGYLFWATVRRPVTVAPASTPA